VNVRLIPWDVTRTPWPLDSESVQTIVTSPPYWGLRDYGMPGQIGLELDVGLYVDRVLDVFREARRVLREDGTLWLNLGDTHYTAKGACWNPGGGSFSVHHEMKAAGAIPAGRSAPNRMLPRGRARLLGLKPGDLVQIPARVSLAMQADGWILRSKIVWFKVNTRPESVGNRPTHAHDDVYLFVKRRGYFSAFDSIREPIADTTLARLARPVPSSWDTGPGAHTNLVGRYRNKPSARLDSQRDPPQTNSPAYRFDETRNVRDVWPIASEPYAEAHFATFPTELPRRCILAGTSDKGACAECGAAWRRTRAGEWVRRCECSTSEVRPCVVLDPFAGAGTTLLVADRLGRDAVGLELKPDYVALARRRIEGDAPLFASVEVEKPAAQGRLALDEEPAEAEG